MFEQKGKTNVNKWHEETTKKCNDNLLAWYGNLNKNSASQEWQTWAYIFVTAATFLFVLFLKKKNKK